jgi:hypothetical protein
MGPESQNYYSYDQIPFYLDHSCDICGSGHSKQATDRESDIIRSLILYGVTDEQMDMLGDNPELYQFLHQFSEWAVRAGY